LHLMWLQSFIVSSFSDGMSLYEKKSLKKLNETELYSNSLVFKTYFTYL